MKNNSLSIYYVYRLTHKVLFNRLATGEMFRDVSRKTQGEIFLQQDYQTHQTLLKFF
jgi:hypothetical protein